MPVTRFYDRSKRGQVAANQGQDVVTFSSGVGEAGGGVVGTFDGSKLLAQFPELYELGRPGVDRADSTDASAEIELEVPAGKYRRLIGIALAYEASADAATRTPVVTIEDAESEAYDTISLPTKTANQRETETILFGTDGRVAGSGGVKAEGTLTLAVNPTAGDTMTIGSVTYTFVAADTGAVTNAIVIGGDLAATKAAVEAKLVTGAQHPQVVFTAFSTNDMVITAREAGLAGDAIATTETFTSGSNVFDATTLGGTTAGVNPASGLGAANFPAAGVLLSPTDKVVLNVTNGHANDELEFMVFYLEFDHDPTT